MALGRTVTISWQGRPLEALLPDPLTNLEMAVPEKVVRATERAIAAVEQADERAHRFEMLARLLLRSEGVASSHIEGVRAPAELVAPSEDGPHIGG